MDVLFEHSLPFFRASSRLNTFPSERSTIPSTNYFGAIIFWSYIGAALYFLWNILRTLLALHKFARYRKYEYSRSGVAFFSLCAFVSFASLSYHMLDVLIQSYLSWATSTGRPLPETLIDILSLLRPHSPDSRLSAAGIWEWSVSSTLFADFAYAITANSARWVWAQADLGVTLVVANWMGIEGRRGTGRSSDAGVTPVPKLWTFFVVLQILPASLTQALFMVALLLSAPPPAGRGRQERSGKVVVLLGKPGYWITSGLLYCFLLVEATQSERRAWLIPMILLARSLLLAPLVLPFMRLKITEARDDDAEGNGSEVSAKTSGASASRLQGESKAKRRSTKERKDNADAPHPVADVRATETLLDANKIMDKASPMQLVDMPLVLLALSTWAVLHQAYWALEEFGKQGILDAVHEHPAVSALGFDFVISLIIFTAWEIFGKHLRFRNA